jgi:Holliday junction resolvase RusA-like endonuclease
MRMTEEEWREQCAKRSTWQRGNEINTDPTPGSQDRTSLPLETPATPGTPLNLPWPPSGQHAHGHTKKGTRYLLPKVEAYRARVAQLAAGARVLGKYRMHVHLSAPDARERDMDNALKTIFDALRHANYIERDSISHMRELVVTTDDDRRGHAVVQAVPVFA